MGLSGIELDVRKSSRQGRDVALAELVAAPAQRRTVATQREAEAAIGADLDVCHSWRERRDLELSEGIASPSDRGAVVAQRHYVTPRGRDVDVPLPGRRH